MMNWRPHTETPAKLTTAVIAIEAQDHGDDDRPYLAGEIYQWRPEHNCWMGETNGLLLKAAAYWWIPERELIGTLPC